MRLGVITTSYPRAPGDPAGSFVAGLARWLAGRGHQVEVIAAGPGAASDGDIAVTRVGGAGLFYDEGAPDRLERSVTARLRAPWFAAALAVAAWRRARAWDRVLSHWILPSGIAAARLGLPHLAVAHSGDVHLAARPLVADATAWALRGAHTVFVAEHLRQRFLAAVRTPLLRRSLGERSLLCPMGVEVAPRDRDRARARLGVGDTPVIAFLGRLVPIKGVSVLIEAARQLPQATLLVAGDGPLRQTLSGARFLGELRGADRDDLLAAADVVAVPSLELPSGRGEGAPTVLIEALAAGAPVVASDVPGIRESAGGAALLVPPGDARALAAALGQVLAGDSSQRIALGRAVAERRSWSHIGPRLLDFWMTAA